MSFSADVFNKKLAGLQETQESIVTISQWVLFHHRHVTELAKLWAQYTLNTSSSAKILSLLYLCNDVVQQARHKRKPEYIENFGDVLPEVLTKCYKKLGLLQPKVDRLIGVWEQRKVFQDTTIKSFRQAVQQATNPGSVPPPRQEKPKVSIAPELKHINDTFLHMNELIDTSQANLIQVGVQSQQYLPQHPDLADSLPSPKVYILKLNTLEQLCLMSKKNIEDIKFDRAELLKALDSLRSTISDAGSMDDLKVSVIDSKLENLVSTRNELKELIEPSEEEEPSPAFDNNNDDDDMMPKYESDDDSDDEPAVKKHKPSPSNSTPNSGSSTPHRKSVAFSEDVQIKEYAREEEVDEPRRENNEDSEFEPQVSHDFEAHHKDAVELKHEQERDDGYAPMNDNSAVLDLLSKLR